jgi:hypothetical protein
LGCIGGSLLKKMDFFSSDEVWYIEMWKDIEGFDGRYEISDEGEVRNKTTGNILKLKVDRDGYHQIGLRKKSDRKKFWFSVHRLVGVHFLDRSELTQIDHIDHNKLNNNVSNLRWVSIQENNLNRELKAWTTNSIHELYISKYKNGYMIRINRNNFKRKHWTAILEDAIKQRDFFLEEIKNM